MIVIVDSKKDRKQFDELIEFIKSNNFRVHISEGDQKTIVGLVGDTSKMDIGALMSFPIVSDVKRVQEPFKMVNRAFHSEDTVVDVAGVKFGGGNFQVIAGPCSVESKEQIDFIAQNVKMSGATVMRGGAFKPRTSPYSFQGLMGEGIDFLNNAKKITGMPIVTEIMNMADIKLFDDVDMIQVGARNMQNFAMLRELGKINKPILLKRGLANTIEELLMSAEYIVSSGNENVILCERGIRTFENYTRNTLDISAIPVLKQKTHLPVIVDPSHACGISSLVEPLALSAVAAGADGLMIEVHNNPPRALCDGAQSLNFAQFACLMEKVKKLRKVCAEL